MKAREALIEREHNEVKARRAARADRRMEEEWSKGLVNDNVVEGGGEDYIDDDLLPPGVSMAELRAAWEEAEESSRADRGTFGIEQPRAYDFKNLQQATEGVVQQVNVPDTFAQGVRCFEGGDLTSAVSCFESVLHVDDTHTAAWRYLGRTHQELDADTDAIVCLEHCVHHDPYDLDSLLKLGVSYVNELDEERMTRSIKAWVAGNGKYGDIPPRTLEGGSVVDMLNSALSIDPSDAEVLEALGVVYNSQRRYEEAVECLEKATRLRPGNYGVWNKLGATLANGGESERALECYGKAIDIKPKYPRAWLNMAISYSNLREYDDASRCYLQTLALNEGAVQCWSYLRLSLTCAERWGLMEAATKRDLKAFEGVFDFVREKGGG